MKVIIREYFSITSKGIIIELNPSPIQELF